MLETLIALILPVLAMVESNNNPSAVGDNGRAVGVLQIWPIMDTYSQVERGMFICGYKQARFDASMKKLKDIENEK